jgi:hypothetical protein
LFISSFAQCFEISLKPAAGLGVVGSSIELGFDVAVGASVAAGVGFGVAVEVGVAVSVDVFCVVFPEEVPPPLVGAFVGVGAVLLLVLVGVMLFDEGVALIVGVAVSLASEVWLL